MNEPLRTHDADVCGGGPSFVVCSGFWMGYPKTNSPGQIRSWPGSPSLGLRLGSETGVRPRMPGCETPSRKPKCLCPRSAPCRVDPISEYTTFIDAPRILTS